LRVHTVYLPGRLRVPAKELVDEIERIQASDENHWRIYGLGERGRSSVRVYKDYVTIPYSEYPGEYDEVVYGLDFGYNNPTALIKYGIRDMLYYAEEVIYQARLTNTELINEMQRLEVSRSAPIYADSAEPNRIEEIRLAGFNIYPADKDVRAGIDFVKNLRIFTSSRNVNLNDERRMYSHRVDSNENVLEEVVKFKDHGMDAERYALWTHHLTLLQPRKALDFR
jgi:phage terminase large subunit